MQHFRVKTDIRYGFGALASLDELAGQRVLVVTDGFLANSPLMATIRQALGGATVEVYDRVTANPDTATVASGIVVFQRFKPHAVVAVGGGSPIDAAKAIVTLAEAEADGAPSFIVIPTTSGSGSEATSYAVISDPASQSKVPLTSESMLPDIAILDPECVRTAPPKLTADAGLDAVSHAVEAYVANDHSDFSDAFAEKALQLLCRWLPVAYKQPDDLAARERVHNAATMAGMAFNNAGLGIVHSLSHAIGGLFPVPHGRLNAMILPHVIAFNAGPLGWGPATLTPCALRYAHLGLMVDVKATTPRGRVLGLIEDCRKLAARLDMPTTMSGAGIAKAEFQRALPRLAEAALHDRCTAGNPVAVGVHDLEAILTKIA
ncbi:MAG: iron-containing alcohol dehydrogenase [Bifidobacteriaceae bacterium]|jgi:alcohol dehydrogenase class IV|nr:iron-containing alcohol dehydrogenase [Bifidobacteriaceae bacterium]